MENLQRELDMCTDFIRATWKSVVTGGFGCPPGAPQLKFDSVASQQSYADSIIPGNSLNIPEAGHFSRSVIATAKIADETERGKPAWDMKPMLLGGPKARLSKSGIKYNIIPFRHGVPAGKNQINAIARTMPKDIHAAAKALNSSISNAQGGMSWGGRLSHKNPLHQQLLSKYGPQTKMLEIPIAGGGMKMVKHTHAAGIYDNMVKVTGQYGKSQQNQYLTFRVVSQNSPQYSWWHPARNGQPHVEWIANYCRPKIEARLHAAAIRDLTSLTSMVVGTSIRI